MTDIEKIREALCLHCSVAAGVPGLRHLLDALDRLAARVGEGWCFDMTVAWRDGTRFIAITKGGIQRIDRIHGAQVSSAKHFWEEVPRDPYVAWRPLPPPPEPNDD